MFTELTSSSDRSLGSWAYAVQADDLVAEAEEAVGGLMVEGAENPVGRTDGCTVGPQGFGKRQGRPDPLSNVHNRRSYDTGTAFSHPIGTVFSSTEI